MYKSARERAQDKTGREGEREREKWVQVEHFTDDDEDSSAKSTYLSLFISLSLSHTLSAIFSAPL